MRSCFGDIGRAAFPALAALLWAGCAGPSPRPAPPAAPAFSEATPAYVALDAASRNSLEEVRFLSRRLAAGRLAVLADLRDAGALPIEAEAQCVFFGGLGRPEATAWQPVRLSPGETLTLRFVAKSAGPRRYSIRVRTAGPRKAG
ncbi:MAG: hypothetical protein ACREFX_01105 [Opitutaceae bacterium]